jgi:hypothetical protein
MLDWFQLTEDLERHFLGDSLSLLFEKSNERLRLFSALNLLDAPPAFFYTMNSFVCSISNGALSISSPLISFTI